MILARYLFKQVFWAWLSITVVLLVIMVASRFASVLNFAAKGAIPKDLLFTVVGLSSLRYLVILMPVSLLLGIMLALGRMYSDNEMTASGGCGVSTWQLYWPVLLMALCVAVLTAALGFQFGPWAGRQADYMVKDSQHMLKFSPFEPGKFQRLENGKAVFYTSSLSANGRKLGRVFVQSNEPEKATTTVVAKSGEQKIVPETGQRILVLHNGYRYLGQPGHVDFGVAHFEKLVLRVAPPPFHYIAGQRQLESTRSLLESDALPDKAELQSRIAMPLSVLILALLALPLSYLRPRQGRYSRLVIGVIIYLVYANLVGIGTKWIAGGALDPTLGLWWIHALVLLLALGLIAHQGGHLRWLSPTGWRKAAV